MALSFLKLDSTQFYQLDPFAAGYLDLAAIGAEAGDQISLRATGDWDAGPQFEDNLIATAGVFWNAGYVSPVAGDPFAFDVFTFYADIPQDFGIYAGDVVVTVPEGAQYLLFSGIDAYYGDNSDPDGDYGILWDLLSVEDEDPVILPHSQTAKLVEMDVSYTGEPYAVAVSGKMTGFDPDDTDIVTFELSPGQDPRMSMDPDGSFMFRSDTCLFDDDGLADFEFDVKVTDDEGNESFGTLKITAPPEAELAAALAERLGAAAEIEAWLEQIEKDQEAFTALEDLKGELQEAYTNVQFLVGGELLKFGLIKALAPHLQVLIGAAEAAVSVAEENPRAALETAKVLAEFNAFAAEAASGGDPMKGGGLGDLVKVIKGAANAIDAALSVGAIRDLREQGQAIMDLSSRTEDEQIGLLSKYGDGGDVPHVDVLIAQAQKAWAEKLEEKEAVDGQVAWFVECFTDGHNAMNDHFVLPELIDIA